MKMTLRGDFGQDALNREREVDGQYTMVVSFIWMLAKLDLLNGKLGVMRVVTSQ